MREDATHEFKAAFTSSYLKTVSAYANYQTGYITFGLSDDGSACGLEDPDDLRLCIENQINESISPVPRFEISTDAVQRTLTLKVFKGENCPYLLQGKAYRRSDTSTVEAGPEALRELCLYGSGQSFDELNCEDPVPKLTFSCLQAKLAGFLNVSALSDDILKTLGLINRRGRYDRAAELLSDSHGYTVLQLACVNEDLSELRDRVNVDGVSLLDAFDQACEYFHRHYVTEKIDGFIRRNFASVPLEAYREAVTNALVHRKWNIRSSVQICFFEDRIEVLSPGGLPEGISARDFAGSARLSVKRNPILADVFSRLGCGERFGMGREKIRKAYEGTTYAPRFEAGENSVTVILPRTDLSRSLSQLSDDEIKVLQCLSPASLSLRRDVDERTGFNQAKTGRILNRLIEWHLAEKISAGPETRYRSNSGLHFA